MTKLKPCPFCGKRVSVYYSSATKGYYAVHSDEQNSECIVLMPLLINGHHLFVCLDDAIRAWNKRAETEAPFDHKEFRQFLNDKAWEIANKRTEAKNERTD